MSTTDLQINEASEIERIEHWREEALMRAGYDHASASSLAMRHDVDLHEAVALLERGCPSELALRILL